MRICGFGFQQWFRLEMVYHFWSIIFTCFDAYVPLHPFERCGFPPEAPQHVLARPLVLARDFHM